MAHIFQELFKKEGYTYIRDVRNLVSPFTITVAVGEYKKNKAGTKETSLGTGVKMVMEPFYINLWNKIV